MSLVGKKYSQALLEVAKEQKIVDEIYEQFRMVMRSFRDNLKLWEILILPSTQTDEKKIILEKIYKDQINGYLYNFLMLSVDKNRIEDIKDVFDSFRELYFAENNLVEANVVSAIELDEKDKERLKDKLEKKYNKTVMLTTEIDKSIIGGLIVYIGDQVIDGSVKRKISLLKNELKEIRLQELGVN
ncbi:ATP synthase F1 subunit delta [Alkalibacter mobilis]|uniref:ATP synthase F1 subunit delta n=1 Tax=Alkalibacter mobilis TaxID=2787712 RepID=UPI00189D2588|nr:ATP synthase F1 subunit delta [Alkalibacter mobilis]MBF7096154.1 F0F1 ATP synthase subunit delta [Alkalibacter mobilis]